MGKSHFSKRAAVAALFSSLCVDLKLNTHDSTKLQKFIMSRGFNQAILDLYKLGSYWFETLETGVPLDRSLLAPFGVVFFNEIFHWKDYQSIYLLVDTDSVSAECVFKVRQLCFFMSKAKDNDMPQYDIAMFFKDYCEKDDILPTEFLDDPLLDGARSIITDLFAEFDPDSLNGKFGPGSVNNCPFSERYVSDVPANHVGYQIFRNHDHFDLDMFRVRPNSHFDYFRRSQNLRSEFLLVPKDIRGPRTICREAAWNQFHQQSLRRYMERSISYSPITGGFVNFADQGINAKLALSSSKTREFATIDLKDASDRITYALVESLFRDTLLFEHMLYSRSQIVYCGSSEHRLKKWAPMGSAICFTTLSVTIFALLRSASNLLSRNDTIYVYGDDIVISNDFADVATRVLETYGLAVNTGKSYSLSSFRESCGTDAYKGHDVTPVRMRDILDGTVDTRLAGYSATSHLLYNRGLYETSYSLIEWMRSIRFQGGRVLPGKADSPYISYPHQFNFGESIRATVDVDRQVLVYTKKGLSLRDRTIKSPESESSFYYRVVYPSLLNRDRSHGELPDGDFELSFEKLSVRNISLRSSVIEVEYDCV